MQLLLVLTLTCRSDLVEAFSCSICCMEQFVSLVAVRLAQELLIELIDLRVVMRLTENLLLILGVEGLSSLLFVCIHDVIGLIVEEALSNVRLTTTVDTTAGASHDLDELIL